MREIKVGDQVIYNVQGDAIIDFGATGTVKKIKGCSCKLNNQRAVIDFNGFEYEVEKFRTKVKLV